MVASQFCRNQIQDGPLTFSSFLLEPYTYQYYNTVFTNGPKELLHDLTTHTTDLTEAKALSFINEAANSTRPFFLTVAGVAPHVELLGNKTPRPYRMCYTGLGYFTLPYHSLNMSIASRMQLFYERQTSTLTFQAVRDGFATSRSRIKP